MQYVSLFVFFVHFLNFDHFFFWNSKHVYDASQAWWASLACVIYMLGVSSRHSHGYKDMQDMVENVKLDISGAFLARFLWFFLLNAIYLGYEILLQSFTEFRSAVVKLCEKWLKMSIMTFLVRFLSVFFDFFLLNVMYLVYKILVQSFTEFRSAVVKLCEKWVVENANHDISGAFLVRFLWFFFLNVIYLGYEILLQSFTEFRSAVVKLCEKWLKMSNLTFLVRFLPVFYDFFCLMRSI